MTERRGLIAAAILCLILIGLTLALTVRTADAHWPTLRGPASTFGNDPLIGFVDYADNCVTASGKSCTVGGIAVNNPRLGWRRSYDRYGGGWWWVCPPKFLHLKCKLLKQNEAGPQSRLLDVSAVSSRRAFGIFASRFPTDEGAWTIRYRGKHKPGRRR